MRTRYPVFVPSKGRWEPKLSSTAGALQRAGVPFRLVVEPQEQDHYAAVYGAEKLLVLPFSNTGTVRDARNWIKELAISERAARHWQIDDNIAKFYSVSGGKKRECGADVVLSTTEDFVDRYANVGIAGISHAVWAFAQTKPFNLNGDVAWCVLVDNSLPYRWRLPSCHDTDYALQVLVGGSCTIEMHAFCVGKATTGTMRGGMQECYEKKDGRLEKFVGLSRMWPRLVTITRRGGMPKPSVSKVWRHFTTPLVRKEKPRGEEQEASAP